MLMRTRWIRELLSFSRTERNGIIALLLVIFLLILAGLLIPLFFPEEHTDFSKWEAEVNAYYSKAEKNKSRVQTNTQWKNPISVHIKKGKQWLYIIVGNNRIEVLFTSAPTRGYFRRCLH